MRFIQTVKAQYSVADDLDAMRRELEELVRTKATGKPRSNYKDLIAKLSRDELEASLREYRAKPTPKRFERFTAAQRTTLDALTARASREIAQHFRKEGLDAADFQGDDLRDEILNLFQTRFGIDVQENGLVTFDYLNATTHRIVGDLPVVVWHYTSSKKLPAIKREGLRPDAPSANPDGNSRAGVYVTTETSGEAIDLYMRAAVAKFGGHGVSVGVKTKLAELEPDPDDADLSVGRHQFVLPAVAPQDLIFD